MQRIIKSLPAVVLANRTITCLALVLAILASTAMANPAHAQLPTPAVPSFTVRYVDYSYVVPPTYGIDQYTGQNVTVQAGYTVDNRTVEFTISNQPFTPYTDASGNNVGLYYNFRYKGHFGDTWSYYPFTYFTPNGGTQIQQTTRSYGGIVGGPFLYYTASTSAYTVITVPLSDLTGYPGGPQIANGSQVDFEVQAQLGTIFDLPSGLLAGDFYNFTGETSDWSSPQTVTIGVTTPATTPTTATNQTTLTAPPTNDSNFAPTTSPFAFSAAASPTVEPTSTPIRPNALYLQPKPGINWVEYAAIAAAVAVVALLVVVAHMHRKVQALESKIRAPQ